jgi:G3E family GTPase
MPFAYSESTGISEPQQVAEAFSPEFAAMHAQAADDLEEEMRNDPESAKLNAKVAQILADGGLSTVSRLDCAVSLVDAVNVFADFETADFVSCTRRSSGVLLLKQASADRPQRRRHRARRR